VGLAVAALSCSEPAGDPTGSGGQAAVGGAGAAAGAGGGSGGQAGQGGSTSSALEALLAALRADLDAAMQAQSQADGWPAVVEGGYLFASLDPALCELAGDHDDWQGTAMNVDDGFCWLVLDVAAGSRYKFTDQVDWQADPWSRAYAWDDEGLMSMLPPDTAHLERFFGVGDAATAPRTIRVWVPAEPPSHVLYVHDGQNLFNPYAIWGGWHLHESAPDAMMLVGIDNTPARTDEYTHVPDDLGNGPVGGQGDDYADFVQTTVRALVEAHYGEPATVGTMGSSLGGLISFHIAQRHPGQYDFAASLSGTMGWGSIGVDVHNETMIERCAAGGHQSTALYLDSGGNGDCVDGDDDGIMDDDPNATDNYCENMQLRDTLEAVGYTFELDLWHWWEEDAPHNEQAWAARVWRPLEIFAEL